VSESTCVSIHLLKEFHELHTIDFRSGWSVLAFACSNSLTPLHRCFLSICCRTLISYEFVGVIVVFFCFRLSFIVWKPMHFTELPVMSAHNVLCKLCSQYGLLCRHGKGEAHFSIECCIQALVLFMFAPVCYPSVINFFRQSVESLLKS